MNIIIAVLEVAFVCGLLPYLLAVCMPSWRWLAICAALVGSGFAYLWIQERILEQTPDYEPDRTGLSVGLLAIATVGFVVGVAVRATSQWLAWAGWRRTGIFLNFGGFAAVIGLFAIPLAWVWMTR